MSTKSREVIFGRIAGAKIRAEGARQRAKEAVREADRRGRGMVYPQGGLRSTRPAVTNHRAMSRWRTRLAPGQMPSVQDGSQHPARLRSAAEGHTDLDI